MSFKTDMTITSSEFWNKVEAHKAEMAKAKLDSDNRVIDEIEKDIESALIEFVATYKHRTMPPDNLVRKLYPDGSGRIILHLRVQNEAFRKAIQDRYSNLGWSVYRNQISDEQDTWVFGLVLPDK